MKISSPGSLVLRAGKNPWAGGGVAAEKLTTPWGATHAVGVGALGSSTGDCPDPPADRVAKEKANCAASVPAERDKEEERCRNANGGKNCDVECTSRVVIEIAPGCQYSYSCAVACVGTVSPDLSGKEF